MAPLASSVEQMVTALVPTLSRSLAEQFNVFRVMHHGTHEKQLSNVFAWLLTPGATHELGDAFQRLFLEHVNQFLDETAQLPTTGYRVIQEVNTSVAEEGADIADIVLTNDRASVVVENYEVSDGHGHGYHRYLAHGALGGRQSVVVLLCVRRESQLQRGGWENAAVLTYAQLLENLHAHIAGDQAWQRAHPRQNFFISEFVQHFTEGPTAVSTGDQIAFIKAMCETGESVRYGHRPQDAAGQEFASLVAQHAQRQFEDGRRTLATVKRTLRSYAEHTLTGQVNEAVAAGHITTVSTNFRGLWEWAVALERPVPHPRIHFEFGPTAVAENAVVAEPIADPDYSKIFVSRQGPDLGAIDKILQTDVGLDDVLAGLSPDDVRLRDDLLAITRLP
ncbi:PD-(D/E)XK nuclease family protein [Ornithinicoccus hortensis]|nr:PD-(D/E)XK nuclease family protein [Ornithinicoccus hortensis]